MTKQPPFVFVIMPFNKQFDDAYELGIKPACNAAGTTCERVDEQTFLDNIVERIYHQIDRAELIVADMTGRNPNVFYEAGFAHGAGKRLILLTRAAEEIPFDLKQYPHLVYTSITKLKQELEGRVKWFIEHPDEGHFSRGRKYDFARMTKHIMNYFDNHPEFSKISFERVQESINATYTDAALLALIDQSPETFRRVKIKGGKPGIGTI